MVLQYSDLYRGKHITQEEFERRALKILGPEYEVGEYKGASVKTEVKHLTCGNIYMQRPYSIYRGDGCPYCARKRNINSLRERGFKIAKNKLSPNFIIVSTYQNANKPLKIKSLDCGHEFWIGRLARFEKNMHCRVCDNTIRRKKPRVHTNVGDLLRSTRLKKGWTAKHLSVVSGISTVEISQIENGRIIATDYERDRLMYYLKGW